MWKEDKDEDECFHPLRLGKWRLAFPEKLCHSLWGMFFSLMHEIKDSQWNPDAMCAADDGKTQLEPLKKRTSRGFA